MKKSYKEPFLCMALLTMMVFEVPFFNLFLLVGFLMLILYIVLYRRKMMVNAECLVLLLFVILYFVIDTNLEYSNEYKFWYSMSAVSLYICGYSMNYRLLNKEERSQKIEYVIRIIAMAYIAYIIITVAYSAAKGQFSISRNPLNLWTGVYRAATHYGTMSVIPLAYGLYLAIVSEKKRECCLGWILVVFTALVAIITASRTILLLVPVGAVIAFFVNIGMRGKLSVKHIRQFVGALTLIGFVVIVFSVDLFGARTLFLKSPLGQRYLHGDAPTLVEDGRWKHLEFFAHNIKKSIWGGGYTRLRAGNLHNIYLNVLDLSGIFPFVLLLVFTWQVIRDYQRMRKNGAVTVSAALLLLLVLSLSFIQMFIEPVMESVPVFFWCILMICGMQCGVSRCT